MKRKIESWKAQLLLVFFLMFNTMAVMAQDGGGTGTTDDAGASVTVSKTTTSTSTTMQDWYTQPWVWIVGGLVFVLLLVALVRGGGSSRTDVHRTTIRKDVSTSD